MQPGRGHKEESNLLPLLKELAPNSKERDTP